MKTKEIVRKSEGENNNYLQEDCSPKLSSRNTKNEHGLVEDRHRPGFVVNKSSCDGCGSCVSICEFSAIKIISLSDQDVKELSWKGKLKVMIKGRNKAYIDPDLCMACGLCIKQCHESAIKKIKN